MPPTCTYTHPGTVDTRILRSPGGNHTGSTVCSFDDGSSVKNYDDLRRCVHEADCSIDDDWHQMAIFRDPRPVTVSAFYHLYRNDRLIFFSGTVDDFVAAMLPVTTQWIAVRHILFEEIIQDRATSFWYRDAMEDPTQWHNRWLQTIGLQLPIEIIQIMVDTAVAGDFGIGGKGFDIHPGAETGVNQTETVVKKFEDEVSPPLLAAADDILRQWLPNVFLRRLELTT